MHQADETTTIEGLGQPGEFHPMQATFVEHDGYQCGYCTSGQIMSAVALLKEPCGPSDGEVKEYRSGDIAVAVPTQILSPPCRPFVGRGRLRVSVLQVSLAEDRTRKTCTIGMVDKYRT